VADVYQGAPPKDPDAEFRSLPDPRTALDEMLNILLREGGSDLHLQADEEPRMRKDGDLIPVPNPRDAGRGFQVPTRTTVVRIIEILLSGREWGWFERADAVALERLDRSPRAEERREEVFNRYRNNGVDTDADLAGFDVDTAYELGTAARFRVNISLERSNPRVVMRKIPTTILSLADLDMPDTLYSLANLTRGLILVTGPTGSGKSTTLAAIIDEINENRAMSILTIEDPVEFVHRSKRSMVAQREVGEDTPTFAESLRRALRQDPDVIMVGEMRDLTTMRIALEAAETGHLVLGTLHTKSAKDTLTRIVNQFPAEEQDQIKMTLIGSLRSVVGQSLLKKRGGGRVAALEIMNVNHTIRAQLGSKSGFQQIEDTIRGTGELGNMLMDDHLFELAAVQRLVEPDDAVRVAISPKPLAERLKQAGCAVTLY
jgi:twitching motility protein PilT